jgi:hypothetical protein
MAANLATLTSRALLLTLLSLLAGVLPGCLLIPNCVLEGSQIATPSGSVPIESLRVGDQVITRINGTETVGTVTWTKAAPSREHLEITLDNAATLRVTGEHPIATPTGFTKAGSLSPGDLLLTRSGQARIESISQRRAAATVHDLSIEPGNVFFADGVLVHNKSYARPPKVAELTGTWAGLSDGGTVYRLHFGDDGTFALVRFYMASYEQEASEVWHGRLPTDVWYDGKSLVTQQGRLEEVQLSRTRPGSSKPVAYAHAWFAYPGKFWRVRLSGPGLAADEVRFTRPATLEAIIARPVDLGTPPAAAPR